MTDLTVRLLCLGFALAGLSVQAQTTVRLDPSIPIAGLVPRATVTFTGDNPSRVTIFVRPVGEVAYETVEASDDGDNAWSIALPYPMPPQGIDVFTEYVRNGETFTEPEQNPALFPFRAPALNPTALSAVSLPARQYRMVTVPLHLDSFEGVSLGSGAPLEVFGDDFGAEGNPANWRLFRWAPGLERYLDIVTEGEQAEVRVRPGLGFWLITAAGGTFDVERGLSTGVAFENNEVFGTTESVFLQTGWNQIGNPFLFPVNWADVQGAGSVEDPIAFQGTYSGPQSTLRPWEGYFVFNPGSAVSIEVPALPTSGAPTRTGSLAQRMRARAGAGASILSVTAESGALTDEVYLGLVETMPSTERPVHLHKPPPVDDGLRLVVRDAGDEWIGRFQTSDAARWTLGLTMPSNEDVPLHLTSEGDWPDGVVVEDLDQDIELAVVEGTVMVPALANISTRHLQIRTGTTTSSLAPLALGTPWPNPTADLVTVPYTLPTSGRVRLEVLDVLGRTVRVLHDGQQDAGSHAIPWDGHAASGHPVAAGTYLVRIEAGGQSATVRVTRLR